MLKQHAVAAHHFLSNLMSNNNQEFKQDTIALVYDFDGTLSPKPMQEYTVFPELGVDATEFWKQCNQESKRLKADAMLTYMRLLIEKMEQKQTNINRKNLKNLAKDIEYFPGVESWFERINFYIANKSDNKIKIKHYIISAGLKEILNGITIKDNFTEMFASEYYFDYNNIAKFPTIVINDTAKTQYLFRINKGLLDMTESINKYMPENERQIPFANMIYFGDGETDVPCMTVAKKNGGYAIAVHNNVKKNITVCTELLGANRIDYFAPADYRENTILDKRTKLLLDVIIANILLEKEKFASQDN